MALEDTRMLFTTERYEHMVDAGVLTEDDRVELIDGEIIEMPPIKPPHSIPVQRLARFFIERLGATASIRVQDAIRLPPMSEPEPDVVVAVPPDTRYLEQHPQAEDVLLLVEVSYTTKRFDRTRKIPLYARSGITEVWLVDVEAERFEVYRDPAGEAFGSVQIVERGGSVGPLAFPHLTIDVNEVLP